MRILGLLGVGTIVFLAVLLAIAASQGVKEGVAKNQTPAANTGTDATTVALQATIISQNATITARGNAPIPQSNAVVTQPTAIPVSQAGQGGQVINTVNGQSQPASQPVIAQGPAITPSYQETGKGATRQFSVQLPQGAVAIIAGYSVDGANGGVYKAIKGSGQTLTTSVTDGFVLVTTMQAGQSEFCNRVAQARGAGQATALVQGLPEWGGC